MHRFEDYVMQNAAYYASKKTKIEASGSQISWNWAAFFFGGNWLAYRKDLKMAVFFNVLNGICTGLAYSAGTKGLIGLAIQLAVNIYLGLYGNSIYIKYVEELQNGEANITNPEAAQSYYSKHSGVSVAYVILALILSAVIARLLDYLGI